MHHFGGGRSDLFNSGGVGRIYSIQGGGGQRGGGGGRDIFKIQGGWLKRGS